MNRNHSTHPHSLRRRIGTLAAAGTVLSVTGLVAVLGVTGAAYAGDDGGPVLDDFLPDNTGIPTFTIPIPDDGPIYNGPVFTIPVNPEDDDDGPIFNGPFLTIPMVPFDPSGPDTTAPADTAPDTTAPADTTAPTVAPPTTPAPETPSSAPTGDVPPFLHITSATVDCAGVLHVTYETGALPQLAPDAEHVVMYSPVSNPAAVTTQRLVQRPQNGVFTVDLQSPLPEQYRVFVIADFEPANLEGVLLVDEADAPAPIDCPVPAG